jgi:hypothetical protein
VPHLDQANTIAFEKTPALFAIEKSSGIKLVEKGARAGTGGCYTLVPKAEPQNLGQMVISNREDNRIIRPSGSNGTENNAKAEKLVQYAF